LFYYVIVTSNCGVEVLNWNGDVDDVTIGESILWKFNFIGRNYVATICVLTFFLGKGSGLLVLRNFVANSLTEGRLDGMSLIDDLLERAFLHSSWERSIWSWKFSAKQKRNSQLICFPKWILMLIVDWPRWEFSWLFIDVKVDSDLLSSVLSSLKLPTPMIWTWSVEIEALFDVEA